RVLALHARHRLEISLGIIAIALIVGVHAQPVHVAALIHLILADNRNIVFRLARNDAVVAAYAGIQINRHAPCVMRRPAIGWGLVVVRRIQRFVFLRLLFVEIRFFLVFLEGRGTNHWTVFVADIHRLVALRGG